VGQDGTRCRWGRRGDNGKLGQPDGVSEKKNAPLFSDALGAHIYIAGICTGGLA
jgi:hypothetical protein